MTKISLSQVLYHDSIQIVNILDCKKKKKCSISIPYNSAFFINTVARH